MKKGWLTTCGVLSAFLSSICCTGPLIFSVLGVGAGATGFLGGSARFAAAIASYRLLFVLLTILFLGLGFYAVYKKKNVCAADQSCSPERLRRTKIVLWVFTGIALILVISPYLLAIGS